jgi:hypothetical protein
MPPPRRSSVHERIESLIAKTTDPVQQATLLLLVSFDAALDANTQATQRIAVAFEHHKADFNTKAFDEHIVEEVKMFNISAMKHEKAVANVRGAWWAASVLVVAILALASTIVSGYRDTLIDLSSRVRVLESQVGIGSGSR